MDEFTSDVDLSLPVPDSSCIVICNPANEMVVTIRYDGSVEYGPGFTTDEDACRLFWEAMGRTFKESNERDK